MRLTATISCDLLHSAPQLVEAVRNDRDARAVACRLLENGFPWEPPSDAQVRVAYALPDGTPGLYSTMPDGSPAGTIDGNTVTIILPDPILTSEGCSTMSVVLLDGMGAQVSSFPFRVRVSGGSDLQTPESWPQLGSGFEGRLFYGGPGGVVTPLKLGPGLSIRDGVLYVSGESEEPDAPTVPVGVVEASVDEDGSLHIYLDGVEVAPVVDESGDLTWSGLALCIDSEGNATLNVKEA